MVIVDLFWAPSTWFRRRLDRAISWRAAAAAPALAAILVLTAQLLFLRKSEAIVYGATEAQSLPDRLFWSITYGATVLSALSYPALWLVASVWLLAMGVLCGRTPEPRQTLGALGLAFYSQVPYLVLMLIAVAIWQPVPLDAGDLAMRAGQFSREVSADPWFTILRVLGHASHLWLFVLFGIGYRVAAPQGLLSITATVTLLYALFIGAGLAFSA